MCKCVRVCVHVLKESEKERTSFSGLGILTDLS